MTDHELLDESRLTRGINPWGPAYAWARLLIAASNICTLLFNPLDTLFHPRSDLVEPPVCVDPFGGGSMFCHGQLGVARLVAVLILAVVMSGFRPQWLALPHAWVAWSIGHSLSLVEGGDQIAANLALLLIPLCLLDRRRSVWDPAPAPMQGAITWPLAVGVITLVLLRIQGFVIYLDAAISKFAVPEWSEGTATYYWTRDPSFAPTGLRGDLALWFTQTRFGAAATTWGTLALELALAAAIIGAPRFRRCMLVLGLLFHFAIAMTFGLVTFGLSAAGVLVIYLAYDLPQISRPRWLRGCSRELHGWARRVVARLLPVKTANAVSRTGLLLQASAWEGRVECEACGTQRPPIGARPNSRAPGKR